MSVLLAKVTFHLTAVLLAGLAACFLLRRGDRSALAPLQGLLFVLPFASGGFYSFWAVPVSIYLFWYLRKLLLAQRQFRYAWDWTSIAVLAVFLGYLLSPLWATDRGMALWGPVRTLPLVLYVLILHQITPDQRRETLTLLPLSGVSMTLLSLVMQFVPAWHDLIVLEGRLAGLFEYANAYALFLLVCLVIDSCSERQSRWRWLRTAVLIFGILASGSRTVMLLTLLTGLLLILVHRKAACCLYLGAGLLLGLGLAAAADLLQLFETSQRVLATQSQDTSFLSRLLYYKDALPVILRHPFGLGYYGYLTAQLGFQTGVYNVTFVHNELLQLLLDIGWLPAIAVCIALVGSFFRKDAAAQERLVLFVIAAHCMLDFDLQFLCIWLILLSNLQYQPGKVLPCRGKSPLLLSAGGVLLALCLWLGAGDLCYTLGAYDACRAVTPFHTIAQQHYLTTLTDPARLEASAQTILRLNADNPVAHSARANAAFSQGDIVTMMTEKEAAIACNYYNLELYCEYFDLLDMAQQLFMQQGDSASAQICLNKLLQIPAMLARVEANTAPLAWKLEHIPELTLPESYQSRLDAYRTP